MNYNYEKLNDFFMNGTKSAEILCILILIYLYICIPRFIKNMFAHILQQRGYIYLFFVR
jgi:hypothetical protein